MKNLHLQLSITTDDNTQIKSITIPLDEYIDMRIGKQCPNIADDIISNMIKSIVQQKQQQNT